MKFAIQHAKLVAYEANLSTGVHPDCLARRPQVCKVFINEQWSVVPVERAFAPNETFDLLNPRRMVNQPFKRLTRFINLLKVHSVVVPVRMRMHVPPPLSRG